MNNYNQANDPVINACKPIADAPFKGVKDLIHQSVLNRVFTGSVAKVFLTLIDEMEALTTPNDPANPTRLKELAVLKALHKKYGKGCSCDPYWRAEGDNLTVCNFCFYFQDAEERNAYTELLADPTYASFLAGLED